MPKKTLLIIAHGSRSDRWNEAIRLFGKELEKRLTLDSPFDRIEISFLEHASPSIPASINRICSQSSQPVVALPLFLSVTHHVQQDIPAELETVAAPAEKNTANQEFHCNGTKIVLIPPLDVPEILAQNAAKRFLQCDINEKEAGVLLVYYGTKRFMVEWNTLAQKTLHLFSQIIPHAKADYSFGGQVVDFQPDPLAQKIQEMGKEHDWVAIIPALVSVGVIQTEVIPRAIQQSQREEKVIYKQDAVLPDPDLADKVLHYAEQENDSLNFF